MGSTAKRRVVAELIRTGEFEPTEATRDASDAVPDGPLDAARLAEIQAAQARLAADPAAELPWYRDFYHRPDLTRDQVASLLAAMEKAYGTPEVFYDEITDALANEGIVSDARFVGNCAVSIPQWFPTRGPSAEDTKQVTELRLAHALDPTIDINPKEHHFELCDPGWWGLWYADQVQMKKWPEGLAPFIQHDDAHPFIYDDKLGAQQVALIADFGVGQYHSKLIARQLESRKYPYVFHLGDVYYGGTQAEFDDRYTSVFAGTMKHSQLFSMPENHELYGGGVAWQKFIHDHRPQIIQEGSYFCVRYPKHQIIGIDVNWHGRQRYLWPEGHEWLRGVVAGGGGRTNILLTGSSPFCYGEDSLRPLHTDLIAFHDRGEFAMWFWGDDHYCALFKPHPKYARFIGSCIGHGGFPGDKQVKGKPCAVEVDWLEDQPRFPPGSGLRGDIGNNGWVELTMLPTGGVALEYIDWLGVHRLHVRYEPDPTQHGQLVQAQRDEGPPRP